MTGIFRVSALFLALGALLNAEPNTPTITSAVPNFSTNPPRLTITGTEFGSAPATVQLNSAPVSSMVSQTQTTIVCTFSSSLAPGTYVVTVTNNDTGKHATASVAITIGAVGPMGPPWTSRTGWPLGRGHVRLCPVQSNIHGSSGSDQDPGGSLGRGRRCGSTSCTNRSDSGSFSGAVCVCQLQCGGRLFAIARRQWTAAHHVVLSFWSEISASC